MKQTNDENPSLKKSKVANDILLEEALRERVATTRENERRKFVCLQRKVNLNCSVEM